MKFHYHKETDSLYIELSPEPSTDSREAAPGLVLDFASDGHIVGLDVQHASKTVDLTHLETGSLPLTSKTVA